MLSIVGWYRIDGVLFVAEFLCSLWSRDQNTFENSIYLLTVSVCRRLGLLPLGLSERAVALICPLDWVLGKVLLMRLRVYVCDAAPAIPAIYFC
jgi:hypothetical protein